MNQDNPYNLQKQTSENEEDSSQLLYLAKLHHPDAVVIDATLGDRGQIVFTTYIDPGETLLEARANEALKLEGTRQFILNNEGAKGVCILSSDEMPSWMKEKGVKMLTIRDADPEEN